jgi:hypothetical protein
MKKTKHRSGGAPPTPDDDDVPRDAHDAPSELAPLAAPSPPGHVLPTSRQLLRSTAIAVAVAGALLVTVVLPAEYGVDPTGIGRVLGLTPMGEIKMSLAQEARAPRHASAPPPACTPAPCTSAAPGATPAGSAATPTRGQRQEVKLVLAPNEGREIKLVMRKGARASYIWSADGALTVDLHGEVEGGPPESYQSYGKATGKRFDEGEIVAAFDGIHGWFWRNRNHSDVAITLRIQGDYEDVKQSGPIAPTRPLDPAHGHGHGHSH